MGLWDRFRKRSAADPPVAPAPEPDAIEPVDPPPDLVAVTRRGMDPPADDYVTRVLAADCPAALPGATRIALSQPRWPANPGLMDSNVALLVRGLARQHALDAGKSSYLETKGPDGADVLLVMMWK